VDGVRTRAYILRMKLLSGHEAVAHVKGILSAKHQVHACSIDLTVKDIWRLNPIGQLDFGGGEYVPAGRFPVEPHRLRPEDNYQWWELDRGCYFVEFNESLELSDDEIALIEPDPRTLRTGATHASVFLRGQMAQLETLFDVQSQHLTLKKNARVSRLRVFQLAKSTNIASLPPEQQTAKPVRKSAKRSRR
jgi:deoxycytidine triphosphate deaminase